MNMHTYVSFMLHAEMCWHRRVCLSQQCTATTYCGNSDENVEYHISIESECLVTVNSVVDVLICAYFVSDIAYPNSLYRYFLAALCILGVKNSQSHHNMLSLCSSYLLMYSTMLTFHIYIFGTNKSKFIVKLLARPMFVITPWRSNRLLPMTLQRSFYDVTG